MVTLCTSRGCELIFSELRLELADMPERFGCEPIRLLLRLCECVRDAAESVVPEFPYSEPQQEPGRWICADDGQASGGQWAATSNLPVGS